MRNLLFSDRLNRGYEIYALVVSMWIMMVLISIGAFAAYFIDISPDPLVTGVVTIFLAAIFWFGAIRKYRLVAVLSIEAGGCVCFCAAYQAIHMPQIIMTIPAGFFLILRYYSEGPAH